MRNRGNKSYNVTTRDTATTNITGSYTQFLASTSLDTAGICLASTANMGVVIGIGPAGLEVDFFAGSTSVNNPNYIPVLIPKGSRLSIKALNGVTISAGVFAMTFFY